VNGQAACLSPLTTGIAELLNEAQLTGGIALILAVMYERALGSRSEWYPYFQVWRPTVTPFSTPLLTPSYDCPAPRALRHLPHHADLAQEAVRQILSEHEQLPIFWGEEDMALLQGTELQKMLKCDKALMREDWLDLVAPFIAQHCDRLPWETMSYSAFKACASLVSSRAFQIDRCELSSNPPPRLTHALGAPCGVFVAESEPGLATRPRSAHACGGSRVHGMGMVPFADMFNHSTNAEHVHVEGNNDSDDSDDEGDAESDDQCALHHYDPSRCVTRVCISGDGRDTWTTDGLSTPRRTTGAARR
jgi:SET domain-containing protein 6